MTETSTEKRLYSARELGAVYGISRFVVLAVAKRLGLGSQFGKYLVISHAEVPALEHGLVAAGHIDRAQVIGA